MNLYTDPVIASTLTTPTPKRQHLTRLLKVWRSDGWPCKDALEIELLVAGWVHMDNNVTWLLS